MESLRAGQRNEKYENFTQHIRSYPGRVDLSPRLFFHVFHLASQLKFPTARPGFLFSVSSPVKKITCAEYHLNPALSATDNRNLDALMRGAGQAIQVNQPISSLYCRQEAYVLPMGNRLVVMCGVYNEYPKLFIGKRTAKVKGKSRQLYLNYGGTNGF